MFQYMDFFDFTIFTIGWKILMKWWIYSNMSFDPNHTKFVCFILMKSTKSFSYKCGVKLSLFLRTFTVIFLAGKCFKGSLKVQYISIWSLAVVDKSTQPGKHHPACQHTKINTYRAHVLFLERLLVEYPFNCVNSLSEARKNDKTKRINLYWGETSGSVSLCVRACVRVYDYLQQT